jgi:predicted nucleic-acid-binding protein
MTGLDTDVLVRYPTKDDPVQLDGLRDHGVAAVATSPTI